MNPTIASTTAASLPTEGGIDRREDRGSPHRRMVHRVEREDEPGSLRDRPRSERALTLSVAAMEYIWLYDRRHGVRVEEIAAREGVAVDRVRFGIRRAEAQESRLSKDDLIEDLKPGRSGDLGFRLIPLFPIGAFTPQTPCPHHRAIQRGSTLCCMVCHASGMDDHPGLRREPETDPAPELQTASALEDPAPDKAVAVHETRKQRRRRLYAESCAVA
jgi:hypothetical protein